MYSFIKNALSDRDIRRRLGFTLVILAVFRLGTHIPVPGVNAQAIQTLASSGLFGMLNTFGGGALKRYSIFAMGVSPYITASIIIQLLQMDIIPKFSEWSKQGEVGRRKLNQATSYMGVALGLIQSFGLSVSFNAFSEMGLVDNPGLKSYLTIAVILTAGTMLLVWLGEQITRKGIGNGVSMIIFAGIVAEVPKEFYAMFQIAKESGDQMQRNLLIAGGVILVLVLAIVLVVLVEQAELKIPIHHSKKASGAKVKAHLPLKINSAGVIPVIFASSFITTPQMLMGYFQKAEPGKVYLFFEELFNLQTELGAAFFALLLIMFAFFYSLMQVNPEQVAENLQKQSAYIPSVRPGHDTETFLTKTINRLSGVGALYLAFIALLPIVSGFIWDLPLSISLMGTSLLIVVGVAIDTAKQIEGRLVKRQYQGFLHMD